MSQLVQYFIGVIFSSSISSNQIAEVLTDAFGPVANISEIYPFDKTRYYAEEMGENLQRQFFALKNLAAPWDLPRMKELANTLEKEFFSEKGKRLVNLDPGYLDSVKVVLASTKTGGHKIALTEKIYADLILDYFQGSFRSFDWTFPDFKAGTYSEYLTNLRKEFLAKIR